MSRTRWICLLLAAMTAACRSGAPEREPPLPFSAVVAFGWPDGREVEGEPGESFASKVDPERVERDLVEALREQRVFSRLARVRSDELPAVVESHAADVVLHLAISEYGAYEGERILAGPAVLDVFLWLTTGLLSWFVPDRRMTTTSELELRWLAASELSRDGFDRPRSEWLREELPDTADYDLTLWDRATLWGKPLTYVVSIIIPPVFNPLDDVSERDDTLRRRSLRDLRRDLARSIRRGSIGTSAAPLRLRLESPANGGVLRGPLRFRYEATTAESGIQRRGFEIFEIYGAAAPKEGSESSLPSYRRLREFLLDDLAEVNESIRRGETVEVTLDLEPGEHLVRFVGITDFGGRSVRNTIRVRVPAAAGED